MTPDAQKRLTIASYNVHGCVGRDGRRDVPRVARVIQRLEADVIALQEVELDKADGGPSHQPRVLGQLTGLQPVAGPTIEQGNGHVGNVILSRLPVRAVRTEDLTFRDREPRGAIDVDLDAGGTKVRVIATHLGLMPGERRHQVRRILEIAAHEENAITVLLGDINEWWVSGRPLRWLHAHFGHCKGARSFPSGFPLFALDRIWVHPKSALACFATVTTPESRVASDHLPVRAEVVLG